MLPDHPIYARGTPDGSGCLLWQGAIKSNGYGHLWHEGSYVSVHRLSWEVANGRPIPDGLRVLHSCDVRRCFRPEHLHLGTAADNSKEMVDRGRYRGPAKLTPDQRAEVARAADGAAQHVVAARFGISQGTVSNIVTGRHP